MGEAVTVVTESHHSRSQDLLEAAVEPEVNERVVTDGGHGEPVDTDHQMEIIVPVPKVY